MKRICKLLAVALIATAAPASSQPSAGQNCLGKSISFFGVFSSGLFEILALFGGTGIGEVASTHCDPSWG